MTDRTSTGKVVHSAGGRWAALALVLALAGTAGSLALSLALGLKACPLCFYQRSFMMGVLAVLAAGLAADRSQARLHTLLALPLALAGLGVGAFHEYLVQTDALECPPGLFGIGTAPAQSLALFGLLSVALIRGTLSRPQGEPSRFGVAAGAAVLGLLLAWAAVASSPPMPPAPSAPYDPAKQPLEMCRPPYRGDASGGVAQ
jgi:disulfide bond formation protein DsbB